MVAAGAELGAVFPIVPRQAELIAAGPVPASVAGQAESVYGRARLSLLAVAAAVWAERKGCQE